MGLLCGWDSLISVDASIHVCAYFARKRGSRPTEWSWLTFLLRIVLVLSLSQTTQGFVVFVGLFDFRVNCMYVSFHACASFASKQGSRQTELGLYFV
jgi:hypothetical protein